MLIELEKKASINIKEVGHGGYKIVYMSVIFNIAVKDDLGINSLFSEIYQQLKDKDIQILQEKIHGTLSKRSRITAIRNRLIKKLFPAENIIPFTFIEGAPCIGGIIAGIQIIGAIIKDKDIKVNTLFFEGKAVGRTFETSYFKEIFLAGISGLQKGERLTRSDQTEHAFFGIKDILSSNDYDMRHIIRTWIYMPNILDWYAEFNKVRTGCFRELGLIGKNKNYLPASTGIQGMRAKKEEIFIDALALMPKTSNCVVSAMKNTCQNEAREYGSLFSRGMAVKTKNSETLYISGTASINNEGKTICIDDPLGQVAQTFKSIQSLLKTRRSNLGDIIIATVYCKNKKAYDNFKKFIRNSKLKNLPFIPVYADICRDNLLFEIDAIAVKIR
jgi:enamine deaminase RidA (YjgF/YER057c/UK114 family)